VRLVLVRHAAVTVRPAVPLRDWHLSPEGREAAEGLPSDPLWEGIGTLYASSEPKAIGTAQRIAAANGARILIDSELREVERGGWSENYRDLAVRYLRREEIDEWEQRDAAQRRMRVALERVPPGGDVAIVSHGLVLTLLLKDLLNLDSQEAVNLWSEMRFPDVAILDLSAGRLDRRFGERPT